MESVAGREGRRRNPDADRYYDRYERDPNATAFYRSAAWLRMRRLILERDHGLCQECLRHGRYTPATAVHHKVELRERWDLRLDADNLESICDECHNRMRAGASMAEGIVFDEDGNLVPR